MKYFNEILGKLQGNLKKFKRNWEQNFKLFHENSGNIIGKIDVIRNWGFRHSEEILEFFWNNFSEIGKKVRRNHWKIVKKYKKPPHKL